MQVLHLTKAAHEQARHSLVKTAQAQ